MNELDQIMAAFRDMASLTAPVASRPASARPYKLGDDPMADFEATKKGLEGQTGNILAALAGGSLGLGKSLASFLGPAVSVTARSPNLNIQAGPPKSVMDTALQRSDQIWNTANPGGSLPTKVNTDAAIAAEQAAMLKPSAEIVPIRKGLAKGNMRNQTEDEVLSAIDKQWNTMATQGGPFSNPQETAINTILGGLKQSPSLRVAADNTKWNAPYSKSMEDAFSSYVRGKMTSAEVRAIVEKEGWTVDKNAFRKRSQEGFDVFDPQGNSHYIVP